MFGDFGVVTYHSHSARVACVLSGKKGFKFMSLHSLCFDVVYFSPILKRYCIFFFNKGFFYVQHVSSSYLFCLKLTDKAPVCWFLNFVHHYCQKYNFL